MLVRERLESRRAGNEPAVRAAAAGETGHFELRLRIHKRLLDRVDLAALESMPADRVRSEIRHLVERLLEEEGAAVNASERAQVVTDIQHEILGLGPLEPLLADSGISEIMVNGPKQVYVERAGKLEQTNVRFGSNAHL